MTLDPGLTWRLKYTATLAGKPFSPTRCLAPSLTPCSGPTATGKNSGVRDLVDLVILIEHDLLDPSAVGTAADRIWQERDDTEPPLAIEALPNS